MFDTETTQLTPAEGYNPKERMIFSAPTSEEIPDSRPKIEYKRINIFTRNEDGTQGELVIPTERLYSFGVSQNTSQETGKVTGYNFPLCLWNRDNPTREEKIWTDTFNAIVECCIDHLVENREEIDMYELTRGDLTKTKGGLNPLYWKKEKCKDENTGKTIIRNMTDRGPTLYAKLIHSKKHDKFLTQFFNQNEEPVEARDLMGKHCYATGAIKIESIFIGSRISLQVKLYEAVVEPIKMGMKRLLVVRPKAKSKVLAAKAESKTASAAMDDVDDNSDDGSLVGSSDKENEDTQVSSSNDINPSKPPDTKKIVTRQVKRVMKKP